MLFVTRYDVAKVTYAVFAMYVLFEGNGCVGTVDPPETPIGTCMVSPEGACAAYYNFGRMHRDAAKLVGQSGRM